MPPVESGLLGEWIGPVSLGADTTQGASRLTGTSYKS